MGEWAKSEAETPRHPHFVSISGENICTAHTPFVHVEFSPRISELRKVLGRKSRTLDVLLHVLRSSRRKSVSVRSTARIVHKKRKVWNWVGQGREGALHRPDRQQRTLKLAAARVAGKKSRCMALLPDRAKQACSSTDVSWTRHGLCFRHRGVVSAGSAKICLCFFIPLDYIVFIPCYARPVR